MAVIYKKTDRISINIDDITIKIRPLMYEERSQILASIQKAHDQKDLIKLQDVSLESIRLCLKGLSGVFDSNGEEYRLQFDENEKLTNDCLSDLLNMESSEKISKVFGQILSGIPNQFNIEGVSFSQPDSKKKKPKN